MPKTSFCPLSLLTKIFLTFYRKHFHPSGFHKSNQEPHQSFLLSSVSNLLIGLWATSLRQEVWKAMFVLEPFTVPSSFSRHGRAPEGGCNSAHLECCVSTQPPSGGSHQHCAALVCASQASNVSNCLERHHNLEIKIE